MNIKKQLVCMLLAGVSQYCVAEQVTFVNNTNIPMSIEYGKAKDKGKYSPNGKESIAPSSEASLSIDLNANDMFYARLSPTPTRGSLSKGKSTYTIAIIPDGKMQIS